MSLKSKLTESLAKADIYPVISPGFTKGRSLIFVLHELVRAGAKIIQLRMKDTDKSEILKTACEFRKICSDYGTLLIVNDFPDIALEAEADGVHLGQDDNPFEGIKKYSDKLIVGVSTHSKEEALEAQEKGATYINLGPIYSTATKKTQIAPIGTNIIKELSPILKIHFTVMGGIKAKNIPELVAAGAKTIAMVTELTEAEDIAKRFCEIRKIMQEARENLRKY